ncbi:thioredoxin domain-containing protein [Candidatus Woesearchaeota archaeon]|nr:thioredoxin domain-containing protein [Candidatus Woesearchaeota archaeon]
MEPGITWRPWSKKAFEDAKKEKKPVFLDLSAVWCHWCHVMDKTSFSDPDVIKLVNGKFIPVRVDIDKRPDIRDRYNFGGYPTIAILNEKGHVLTGTTYVPPKQLENMLEQIKQLYKTKYDQLQLAPPQEHKPPELGMEKLDENIAPFVTSVLTQSFDTEMGGFGREPKFPAPGAVTLLLLNYAKTGEQRYLDMVTLTLDNMKRLLDDAEGGFYRYSVTRDWRTPHYEKMLDTNAGLLLNYLDAYSVIGNNEYKRIARRIIDYVDASLYDKEHSNFYGSQDADEEYYKLPLAERKKRKVPYIDKTVYTDNNSQMIIAYLRAAAVLEEPKYLDVALKSLQFLLKTLFKDKEGMYHYHDSKDNKADVQGIAADNVWCMRACIEAYEHTADTQYLTYAEKLAAFIAKNLVDKYGLHDRVPQADDFGELTNKQRPLEDNAAAAHAFTSLAVLTENDRYHKIAETILLGLSGAFEAYGHFAANYAVAVDHFLRPIKIVILGKTAEQKTKRLRQSCLMVFDPRKSVILLDVEKDKKRITEARYPANTLPVAFLCAGKTCSSPIQDEVELLQSLKSFK